MRIASALAIALVTLIVPGCARDTERALLSQFFAASRLRDLTALQKFATVVFEPATDGIVTSFEILQTKTVPGPDGMPLSEQVSISAPVRLPDGETVTKTFVVTLERRPVDGDRNPARGWMITAFSAGPASPSAPRS
jgi:hypothetical protein